MATNLDSGFYNLAPTYPSGFNAALSFVTPFTHRTNISYAELLMELYKWLRENHLPELENVLKNFKDEWEKFLLKYESDFNDLKSDIDATKDQWQDFFDQFMQDITNQLAIMNDNAVAILMRNSNSETRKATEENFIPKNKIIFNVRDYGAKLNGVSDDTTAVRNCATAIKDAGGGFMVAYPPGKWLLDGQVALPSHCSVDGTGSELHRTASGYVSFTGTPGGGKGYGAGGKNISITGFDVYGNFSESRSQNMVFHHISGLKLTNMRFYQAVTSGHCVDILGCENIYVSDCFFYGRKDVTGRLYVEAVQIDCSTRSGAGAELTETDASWDGLPCRNYVMERCYAYPITVNSTYYQAPRLTGSHSRLGKQRHTNIVVRDFEIIDSGSTLDDSNYRGWIHFTMSRGVLVENGVFRITRDANQMMIGFGALPTTYPMSSVAISNPSAGNQDGRQSNEDITVRNIDIYGVNGAESSNLINFAGYPDGRGSGVHVSNIKAYDFHPGGDFESGGGTIVNLLEQVGVSVSNIFAKNAQRIVNADSCDNVSLNGLVGDKIYYSLVRAVNCKRFSVHDLQGSVVTACYFDTCSHVNVDKSQLDFNMPVTRPYRSAYSFNACSRSSVDNVQGIFSGSLLDYHIYIYGGSSKIRVTNPTAEGVGQNMRVDTADSQASISGAVNWTGNDPTTNVWADVALATGITGQPGLSPRVRLRNNDTVEYEGGIVASSIDTADTLIGTIPAAYRPSKTQYYILATHTSSVIGRMRVQPSGEIYMQKSGTPNYLLANVLWATA